MSQIFGTARHFPFKLLILPLFCTKNREEISLPEIWAATVDILARSLHFFLSIELELVNFFLVCLDARLEKKIGTLHESAPIVFCDL